MTITSQTSRVLLKYGVLLLGCAACAFAWTEYRTSQNYWSQTKSETQSVLDLVHEIRSLRPDRAVDNSDIPAEPSGFLQVAMSNASIPASGLASVTPERVERVGEGIHPFRRTRIELDSVTIEQATRFMAAIETLHPLSTCTAIDLARTSTRSRWTLSLTIQRPIQMQPTEFTSLTNRAPSP